MRIIEVGGSPIHARAAAPSQHVVDIIVKLGNGPEQSRGIALGAGMGGWKDFMDILGQPARLRTARRPWCRSALHQHREQAFERTPTKRFCDWEFTCLHATCLDRTGHNSN